MLQHADRRGSFIRGINLSTSRSSYEAAAMAQIISQYAIDGSMSRQERAIVEPILHGIARDLVQHLYAWYDFRTTWLTFGPDVSRNIRTWATRPRRLTAKQGIFTAWVIVHEIEHGATPTNDEDYARWQWVEEGTADVFALWPGAAAHMAKQIGMPYPKRFERVRYVPDPAGGYPEWSQTLYILLGAAGVDVDDPDSLPQAYAILQSSNKLDVTLDKLARAIAAEQGLSHARTVRLIREVRAVNGEPSRAKRIVRDWI
jgi:hypothetical protein